jgi:hypothetical protein
MSLSPLYCILRLSDVAPFVQQKKNFALSFILEYVCFQFSILL